MITDNFMIMVKCSTRPSEQLEYNNFAQSIILIKFPSPCCLDVFHSSPVAREIEGRHQEADDIEGDDGQDNQVVI